MKNLLLAGFCVVALFSSCKKDYTCTCTTLGQTISTEYLDIKKSDAEDACDAAQTAAQSVDSNASCSLD